MGNVGIPEFALLLLLALYFLPTIIAAVRKKRNLSAILLVNLLLGWSIIGWIVALVWAVSTEVVDTVSIPTGSTVQHPSFPPQGKFCSSCGKYSQADSRFCAHCGNALA